MKRLTEKVFLILSVFIMTSTVIANNSTKTINVDFGAVGLEVNNVAVEEETLLYNGSTYVPLRAVSETLGLKVDWNQETSTASISKGIQTNENKKTVGQEKLKAKKDIVVKFNSINIIVDNTKLEKENILYEGVTYVPLRAISELLGARVDWDPDNSIAKIITDPDTEKIVTQAKEEPIKESGLSFNNEILSLLGKPLKDLKAWYNEEGENDWLDGPGVFFSDLIFYKVPEYDLEGNQIVIVSDYGTGRNQEIFIKDDTKIMALVSWEKGMPALFNGLGENELNYDMLKKAYPNISSINNEPGMYYNLNATLKLDNYDMEFNFEEIGNKYICKEIFIK